MFLRNFFPNFQIFDQHGPKFLLISKPFGAPVFVDGEAETDRMDFLTHDIVLLKIAIQRNYSSPFSLPVSVLSFLELIGISRINMLRNFSLLLCA